MRKFLGMYRNSMSGMRIISEKTGVSVETLYKIQAGKNEPNLSTLKKISNALNAPLEDIVADASLCFQVNKELEDNQNKMKCFDCGKMHIPKHMYECTGCGEYICSHCVPVCYRCYSK